jgi:hypothetical protein
MDPAHNAFKRTSSQFMEPPDKLEKGIRLGCGGIFGLFIGAVAGFKMFPYGDWSILAVALTVAIAFSLAARCLGDRFWHAIGAWLQWWQ